MLGSSVRALLLRGIAPELEAERGEIGLALVAGKLGSLARASSGSDRLGVGALFGREYGRQDTLITLPRTGDARRDRPRLKQFTVPRSSEDYNELRFRDSRSSTSRRAEALRMATAARACGSSAGSVPIARESTRDLFARLRGELYISDWTRSNANYFRASDREAPLMFIILLLIVLVAAFNSVSTLVMAVTDKQADIAILRTLGASPRRIMKTSSSRREHRAISRTFLGVRADTGRPFNIDVDRAHSRKPSA